jgi:hypothetical protein
MSDIIENGNENGNENEIKRYTFKEAIPIINEKYILLINEIIEKFKYHDLLYGTLQHDLKIINEKLTTNEYQVINLITDNFLFCLEQINDFNSDYFIYQKDKVHKKHGKVYKNKLPKLGIKTLFKNILEDSDKNLIKKIFKELVDLFKLLTLKDENNVISFNQDYIDYINNNFDENKNYSKILMVIDNLDNILNCEVIDDEIDENLEDQEEFKNCEKKSTKNKKKNKDKKSGFEGLKNLFNGTSESNDFMKNLENTKIAQLAKNISEKINMDDFPDLTDPSKLLNSFTNADENGGGIGNLLKFVVGEVETAMKGNSLNETDLLGEAQNLMGQFQNLSGFNPLSLFGGENGLDPSKLTEIFENMKK